MELLVGSSWMMGCYGCKCLVEGKSPVEEGKSLVEGKNGCCYY
jgi:hypothetical protein